jgi:hypothetical protein
MGRIVLIAARLGNRVLSAGTWAAARVRQFAGAGRAEPIGDVGDAMDAIYVGIIALLMLAAIFGWGTKDTDRTAIERDLERRGRHLLHIELLP